MHANSNRITERTATVGPVRLTYRRMAHDSTVYRALALRTPWGRLDVALER